jgi:hypothetical protein
VELNAPTEAATPNPSTVGSGGGFFIGLKQRYRPWPEAQGLSGLWLVDGFVRLTTADDSQEPLLQLELYGVRLTTVDD